MANVRPLEAGDRWFRPAETLIPSTPPPTAARRAHRRRAACHDGSVTTYPHETLAAGALDGLRSLTADQQAEFRPGQLEAIRDVVLDRARVLCVQRTGWGKSAVYFVATALLRETAPDRR